MLTIPAALSLEPRALILGARHRRARAPGPNARFVRVGRANRNWGPGVVGVGWHRGVRGGGAPRIYLEAQPRANLELPRESAAGE